ncbi:VOC family protein [Romeria aff. gracilis LEGE 07310]|uniref:VOC family protein n=1 Tax=Vasconcelosia minhoensis LEGE 07310 TaxID=915328 RepID=A0A8J7AAH2_9CYAN|nr:ArsI/CadI family heavy metal resistance metalloenzyme [Romeria gracilis]MBE9077171.1 VOC family protein [Romeria aff. gracilis LEGE 07310]
MATFKTHVALRVADLNRSIAFYRAMFGTEPMKHKADYAKFDLENPGLNLTLNVSDAVSAHGTLSHLGIQVDSSEAVGAAIARFKTAGLATFEEHDTDCCYALQDKVWVTDPDGMSWEIFVVKVADTAPEATVHATDAPAQIQSSCCA